MRLIRQAFALAKHSGKDDWHRMYAGVLKNRLLLITDSEFDESDWGVPTFTAFLELFPEALRVERGTRPPIVELLQPDDLETTSRTAEPEEKADLRPAQATAPETSDPRRWRIRRDLWDAVLGVRDPDAFMWQDGAVVRVPQDKAMGISAPRLPTLTGPELDSWRNEFAREQPDDPRYTSVLASWARGEGTTASLPRRLQHLWYARLKKLVRDRLESWFGQHDLAVPRDMLEVHTSRKVSHADSVAALRTLVRECIDVMTEDELQALSLPPAAVLRLRR
jgi:hypothetical protein